jgi:flagellar motor switch protein FliM
MRRNLEKVGVELKVVLGGTDIKVDRLVRATPGDVIMLDRELGDPVDVYVNEVRKFQGYPGQTNGKLAVKVLMEELQDD